MHGQFSFIRKGNNNVVQRMIDLFLKESTEKVVLNRLLILTDYLTSLKLIDYV